MERTIVFSDFDGTLFFPEDSSVNRERNARNFAAIQRFRRSGGEFAITTGRGLRRLTDDLPDYGGYADYLVTLNGANFYASGQIQLRYSFAPGIVAAIEKVCIAHRREIAPIFYGTDEVERPTAKEVKHQQIAKVRLWFYDPELRRRILRKIQNTAELEGYPFTAPENANYDHPHIPWVPQVMCYAVDVMQANISKAAAIKEFASGLSEKVKIVTVGDDLNDLEMIRAYNGFVVGKNSPIAEKVTTSHVVESLEELLERL